MPAIRSKPRGAYPPYSPLPHQQVMDKVVESLTRAGLMVVLNNHIGTAGWCCSSTDGQGLWYSDAYPQSTFFGIWQTVAQRYGASSKYLVGNM